MTDHVALMRQHAAQLRAQADRYDQAADLIENETPASPKRPLAKKEKRAGARPTRAGRKAGQTRTAIVAYLKQHPKATAREVGAALHLKPATASYHLTNLRR